MVDGHSVYARSPYGIRRRRLNASRLGAGRMDDLTHGRLILTRRNLGASALDVNPFAPTENK